MKKYRCALLVVLMLSNSAVIGATDTLVVGWQESVRLMDEDIDIEAKIDTGADNSSINAVAPRIYEKSGRKWISFNLQNRQGKSVVIDRPVLKSTRVKMKNGDRQRRYVIELTLCLGKISKTVPVNLVDRSHFKYQLLVGRSFLRHGILVDSDNTQIARPQCQK